MLNRDNKGRFLPRTITMDYKKGGHARPRKFAPGGPNDQNHTAFGDLYDWVTGQQKTPAPYTGPAGPKPMYLGPNYNPAILQQTPFNPPGVTGPPPVNYNSQSASQPNNFPYPGQPQRNQYGTPYATKSWDGTYKPMHGANPYTPTPGTSSRPRNPGQPITTLPTYGPPTLDPNATYGRPDFTTKAEDDLPDDFVGNYKSSNGRSIPGTTDSTAFKTTRDGKAPAGQIGKDGKELPWTRGMKAGAGIGAAALAASAYDAFRKAEVEKPHTIKTNTPNLRFDERPLYEGVQGQSNAAGKSVDENTTSAAVRRAARLGITANTSEQMSRIGVTGQQMRNQLGAQKFQMDYSRDAANSQIKTMTDDINARNRAGARLSRDTFYKNMMNYGQDVGNASTAMAENRGKLKFADGLSRQYDFDYETIAGTYGGGKNIPEGDVVVFNRLVEKGKTPDEAAEILGLKKKGGYRKK